MLGAGEIPAQLLSSLRAAPAKEFSLAWKIGPSPECKHSFSSDLLQNGRNNWIYQLKTNLEERSQGTIHILPSKKKILCMCMCVPVCVHEHVYVHMCVLSHIQLTLLKGCKAWTFLLYPRKEEFINGGFRERNTRFCFFNVSKRLCGVVCLTAFTL